MKHCKRIYWDRRRKFTSVLPNSIAHLWIQLELHTDSTSYSEFIYVKENCAEFIIPGDRVFITDFQLQHVLHKEVKNIMQLLPYLSRKISRLPFLSLLLQFYGKEEKGERERDLGLLDVTLLLTLHTKKKKACFISPDRQDKQVTQNIHQFVTNNCIECFYIYFRAFGSECIKD